MVQKKTVTLPQASPKAAPAAARGGRPAAKLAAAKPAIATEAVEESVQGAVQAGAAAVEVVETVVQGMVQAGTVAAKEYEKAVAAAQDQVEKTSIALARGYGGLTASGTDTMDAYVKCGTIVAKGMEALGKEVIKFAQASVEANLTATRNLMAAKTLREAMELQAGYSRDSFDSMVSEAARLTEMSVDLANEVMDPIQTSLNATAESVLRPLAR